jgi:alcohol dehydrogenase class IV
MASAARKGGTIAVPAAASGILRIYGAAKVPHYNRQALATMLGMAPLASGVPMGASHGIGYVLGAVFDIPHGHTSCIMLPAVMRWNKPANTERQALVARRRPFCARLAAATTSTKSTRAGRHHRRQQGQLRRRADLAGRQLTHFAVYQKRRVPGR